MHLLLIPILLILTPTALDAIPQAEYNLFGGWTGVQTDSKVHFYTAEIEGVWWIVDPGGNAFFSKGVNHITFTADFSPQLGYSPYGRATLDKYKIESAWADATAERLRNWGFNTIGSWSSPVIMNRKIPFTINLNIGQEGGANWQHGIFPDVFSEGFTRAAKRVARLKCRPQKDNLYLLGYFTDNELRWGADWRSKNELLIDFLKMKKEAAGRQAAVNFLLERHKTIEELNESWNVNVDSFDALAGLKEIPASSARTKDEQDFQFRVAQQYFRVCYNAIRNEDPNHMILGVRFAGKAPEPVLLSLKDYVDIVSFNTYNARPPKETLGEIHAITGRPLMITEFSFKAMDSGLPNSKGAGKPLTTQQERADSYATFVTDLARMPYVVGYHWFEYADQPKEGRFDGENSNYGLVNLKDEPWKTLTDEMSKMNTLVETIHAGSSTKIENAVKHE